MSTVYQVPSTEFVKDAADGSTVQVPSGNFVGMSAAAPSSFQTAWAAASTVTLERVMRKNVAGQVVVAQLNSKTDGSAVTSGTTTVYVLGDGGAQGAGSGTVTHEGNGCWSYLPTQAETNYDHVAFTFTNTSAVAQTVQVYTNFPQTGDNYARLGAPAGASIAADIAGVQSDTDNIQTRIPAALVSGRMDASVGAMAADVLTSTAVAASAVTEIQAGLSTLDAAGVRAAVGLASANLDTQLDALPTAAENADALLGRNVAGGSSTGRLVKEALYFLRNKWTVSGGTLTVYQTDDTTSSWTAVVTGTAGADPVTGNDPA